MTKLCDQCGKELIKGVNRRTMWARRCVLLDSDELSPCQKAKNKDTARLNRENRNKADKEDQYAMFKKQKPRFNEAMRECLRCDEDENGVIPTFLSEGPYNRICESCTNKQEGVNMDRFSLLRGEITSVIGVTPDWDPRYDPKTRD